VRRTANAAALCCHSLRCDRHRGLSPSNEGLLQPETTRLLQRALCHLHCLRSAAAATLGCPHFACRPSSTLIWRVGACWACTCARAAGVAGCLLDRASPFSFADQIVAACCARVPCRRRFNRSRCWLDLLQRFCQPYSLSALWRTTANGAVQTDATSYEALLTEPP
jgi:hypothetical protein